MGKKKKQVVDSDSDSESDNRPRYHVGRLLERDEVCTTAKGDAGLNAPRKRWCITTVRIIPPIVHANP
jgi:hypothetical protein